MGTYSTFLQHFFVTTYQIHYILIQVTGFAQSGIDPDQYLSVPDPNQGFYDYNLKRFRDMSAWVRVRIHSPN